MEIRDANSTWRALEDLIREIKRIDANATDAIAEALLLGLELGAREPEWTAAFVRIFSEELDTTIAEEAVRRVAQAYPIRRGA